MALSKKEAWSDSSLANAVVVSAKLFLIVPVAEM